MQQIAYGRCLWGVGGGSRRQVAPAFETKHTQDRRYYIATSYTYLKLPKLEDFLHVSRDEEATQMILSRSLICYGVLRHCFSEATVKDVLSLPVLRLSGLLG